jgi:PAS domain-containing protein
VSAPSAGAGRLVFRLHRIEPRPARHVVDLAAAAHDPCLVLDAQGHVISLSVSAAALLGLAEVGVVGRPLLTVVDLVDFETGASDPDYASRVAPLAVLAADFGLMRSLLRVRHDDGSTVTLDTSSAPLHDVNGAVVGSITFFSRLGG